MRGEPLEAGGRRPGHVEGNEQEQAQGDGLEEQQRPARRSKPRAPWASIAQALTVLVTESTRPSASRSRLAWGTRAYMMTVQTNPAVTETATTAVGTVNQVSAAVQMRSPTTSTSPNRTRVTTIWVSMASIHSVRDPDRARIMAMPAAPNSGDARRHGDQPEHRGDRTSPTVAGGCPRR